MLIDTHIFLWMVFGDKRLRPRHRELMAPGNHLILSYVSLWEIAVKTSVGRIQLGMPYKSFVRNHVQARQLRLLTIEQSHFVQYAELPAPDNHRDPFDRLLIAQAQREGLQLLTDDPQLEGYGVPIVA